ncbi:hypothetical protein MTO96_036254 [Rhipicephalus appendiculatus]
MCISIFRVTFKEDGRDVLLGLVLQCLVTFRLGSKTLWRCPGIICPFIERDFDAVDLDFHVGWCAGGRGSGVRCSVARPRRPVLGPGWGAAEVMGRDEELTRK